MTISIRAYEHKDKDALAALLDQAFPNNSPWNEPYAMIDQKLANSPESLLVGADDDGLIVAAVMAGYDGHRGWINTLCVLESHRGQGIGEQIMNEAVALLNAQGAVKVNLQIRGNNTRLQQYYESLGFETEDRLSLSIITPKGKEFS